MSEIIIFLEQLVKHPFFLLVVSVMSSGVFLKIFTQRWQDKRYKLDIKNEIVKLFHESLETGNNLQYTLLRDIGDYCKLPPISYGQTTEEWAEFDSVEIRKDLDLPNPKIQFLVEKFKDDTKMPRSLHFLLVSKLKLYVKKQETLGNPDVHYQIQCRESSAVIATKMVMKLSEYEEIDDLKKNIRESYIQVFENRKNLNSFIENFADVQIKNAKV
ncbi:MAG: hypothetical protein GKS07_05995 [Nitrosopumilus sp.]|nr:MAG: hypothetical protein GKS07_05995 [Nitrosopumilus sp.]